MSMKFFASLATISAVSASGVATSPTPTYATVADVKVEVPAVPYCPDGSTYESASGCAYVNYAEPKSECPHPYKLDSKTKQCLTTTIGQSSLTCSKGSYLEGSKCVTEITTPVELSCTRGELTADGCIVRAEPVIVSDKVTPITLSCNKGYKLNGDMCVKEVTIDADIACDAGFTLSKNTCITYETTGKECPAGYSIAGETCIAVAVTTPDYSCPKNSYADKSGNCLTEITQEPTQVCEKGYVLNKKNKCEAQVLITAVLQDKKGVSQVEVDCKIGTLDKSGNCYQTYTTDSVTVCDAGFELNGKKCVAYIPVEAVASCPSKHTLEGSECVYTRTTGATCPKGFTADSKTSCIKTVREGVVYVCPKGFNPTSKDSKCSVMEVETPVVSCPKSYEMVDGECVIPGYVIAGQDKVYDIKYSCPKGFTLNKTDLVCVDTLSEDAQVVCEKGYTYINRRCVATHTTPAQLMCPSGFSFDNTQKGNLCQKVSFDRPVFRCPEGSTDSGNKCYVYSTDKQPIVLAEATAAAGKKLRRI